MTQSPVKQVEELQAKQLIASEAMPILIDVGAAWCEPCKMLRPFMAKFAGEFAGRLVVAELDGDAAADFKAEWQVDSFPTLLFFKGGVLVKRSGGCDGYADLRAAVWDVVGVDPEEQATAARESEFAAAAARADDALNEAAQPTDPRELEMWRARSKLSDLANQLWADVAAGTLSRDAYDTRLNAEEDKLLAPFKDVAEASAARLAAATDAYIAAIESAAAVFSAASRSTASGE